MWKAHSRLAAAVVLAVGITQLASGIASADSPTIPTIKEVTPTPLTPYTSGGCFERGLPCYKIRGSADPGIKLILTATDEVNPEFEISEIVHAARVDDPGAKIEAGDWVASPNVTDLGTHGEDPSLLTFTAVAENPDGNRSAPASITVEKAAATPGDSTAPRITVNKRPPGTWCHLGPSGAAIEPVPGVVIGVCFPSTSTDVTPLDPGYGSWGIAQITGRVEDDIEGAFGIASEIADVLITITQSDGTVIREIRSFARRGQDAYFNTALNINDFPPGSYEWVVTASDAWGHESEEVTGTFVVAVL